MLGGYDPEAGRNAHEADKPTLIPVPSLLRSLLSDHLDPGYAAAAQAKAADRRRTWWQAWAWQVAGALVIAAVFAAAVAQARSTAPGVRESQQVLAGSVRSAETATDEVTARRNALTAQVDAERRSRLEGDDAGQQLLGNLDEANFAAAATPVIGPGLTITVTDPGMSEDLSDVSKQRVEGSQTGDPRPRSAAGGQLAVGQRRRGDLGGRGAHRTERDDPAGGRRHPGRQSTDQQPVRHSRGRSAARDAGRLRSQSRACSAYGCWRPPTASG